MPEPGRRWGDGINRAIVWLRCDRVTVPFFLSLIVLSAIYRALLFVVGRNPHRPLDGQLAEEFTAMDVLAGLSADGWVAGAATSALALARIHATSRGQRTGGPATWETIVWSGVLGFVAAAMAVELYLIHEQLRWWELGTLVTFLCLALGGGWQPRSPTHRFALAFLAMSLAFAGFMAWTLTQRRELEWDWLPFLFWKSGRYLAGGLAVGALWRFMKWINARPMAARLRAYWPEAGTDVLLTLVLTLAALAMFTHFHLLREFQSGLTWPLVAHGWTQMSGGDFVRMIPAWNLVALTAPAAVFILLAWWHGRGSRVPLGGALAVSGMTVLVAVAFGGNPGDAKLTGNPIVFFGRDVIATFGPGAAAGPDYARDGRRPGETQMQTLALMDPAFVAVGSPAPPALEPTDSPARPWNVVFFILESTGAKYIFDTAEGNEVPMPFLQKLAREGVHLRNHYTTSGTSAESGFSLLTGLYPAPGGWLGNWPDNHQPTINRFFSANRDTFYAKPVSMTFAFPKPLLVNNGFTNLIDRKMIPSRGNPDRDPQARNELDGISHFIDRLDAAREPFTACYMPFVPHWPYSDYGPEYALFPYSENERHAYYNNLRLLDTQIRRVHQHLAKRGLLERTVFVLAGDHGEAFGQHLGVWKHGIATYDETFRTPVILWQPALFTPTAVDRLTSHVDVLPTLLDAVGVAFNERLFQGESLFRPSHRKYVFTTTLIGDYVTAIGHGGEKVSVSFKRNEAYAYNLAKNPNETIRLRAATYPAALDAVLKFRNWQRELLPAYSDAVKEGREFFGERHPRGGRVTRAPTPVRQPHAASVGE